MPGSVVGVVIPLFESGATIALTLRSLLDQTLADWRAIVINDGSTDDGPDIARRFAGEDSRIRVIDQPNRGLSGARNRGLDEIDAEHAMFLDADDLLHPEALDRLVRAISETGLPGAYCGYEFLDDDARPIGRQTAAAIDEVGLDELLDWNRFVVHSQLIRTDALADLRFDESLTSGEDYDLWLRLGACGVRWAGVDRFLAGYRIRTGSMSKDFRRMAANEATIIRHAFERLGAGPAISADGSAPREHRALTRSALAYASRLAIGPRGDAARAADVFAEFRRDHPLTPGDVATASIFAIQFGAAAAPDVVTREPEAWAPSLDRWWRTIGERGWGDQRDPGAFAERTLEAFASRSIHPREVARESVRRAAECMGPIRAPFDARARWIGRVAPERALRVVYSGPGAGRLLGAGRHDTGGAGCSASIADGAGGDPWTVAVVPPEAGGPGAIEWDEAHRALASSMLERLASLWSGAALARP